MNHKIHRPPPIKPTPPKSRIVVDYPPMPAWGFWCMIGVIFAFAFIIV